jgi:hypothetical protein
MSGYWVILAFWTVTALPGAYLGWELGGGHFDMDWSSPSGIIASSVAVAWLLFPAWSYWFYWFFKRRAERKRW